jgi:hypothetical protein
MTDDAVFDAMYDRLTTGSRATRELTAADCESLDVDGFVVLPGLMDETWRAQIAEEFDRIVGAEGDDAARAAGTSYQPEPGAPRVSYCVNRGRVFETSYTHATVLAAALHVIGGPFKFHSLNARDVETGRGHQDLHPDSVRPTAAEPFHLINTLWLLDDFTETNGATRIVPGSHLIPGPISDHVTDRQARHPDEVLVTGPKGTVVVFNGHCWHGGTTNTDGARRRVLHASYIARTHPQQVDCASATEPGIAQALAPEVRYLLDL